MFRKKSSQEKEIKLLKKGKGLFNEFKEFISRGNVFDLAVGIIIGAAFTAIVNSLVADLFMPLLGLITGGVNFSELKVVLKEAVIDPVSLEAVSPEVALNYGIFIEKIINFLLVALAVFAMIKMLATLRAKMELLKKKEEEIKAAEEAEKPDPQIQLLTEIRDLLKKE